MQTILVQPNNRKNTRKELAQYTDKIGLSAAIQKVNTGDELIKADLLNRKQVIDAVKGSDVVYLTAGLKYDSKYGRLSGRYYAERY
jgi:hypothetical protein